MGALAEAPGEAAVALGADARAAGAGAAALGENARAVGAGSVALGRNSTALLAGSVAIGEGAQAVAANQVSIGGAGSSVRIGDIASSTSRQVGTVGVATVDGGGTLGRDTTIIPAIGALQTGQAAQAGQIAAIQGVNATQTAQISALQLGSASQGAAIAALQSGQSELGGRVDTLFELGQIDRRDTREGIAAAVAMGNAPMPSAAGRTSYVFNIATFRGQQALGGSIMHRVGGDAPLAIGVGFSLAGHKNNAFRAGIAGEF
jgi:autotransporter adhesin